MTKEILRGDKAALAMVLLVVSLGVVSALPGVPHQFYGSLKDPNGNSAPDGIMITAKINGESVKATTTKNGNYGLEEMFYISDPNGDRAGEIIEFYVKDKKVVEYAFSNGKSTELNLVSSESFAVATSTTSSTSSGGGGGGGSGGGGGGGGSVNLDTNSDNETTTLAESSGDCEPDWVCSEWLDCINTVQKRVCTDENSCGSEEGKPKERRECQIRELSSNPITGAAIAVKDFATSNKSYGILGAVVILAVLVFAFKKRKKEKIPKEEISHTKEAEGTQTKFKTDSPAEELQ